MGARKRITVADVAREAGVSQATVSYVLNDNPNQKIPDATRRRVRDAVEKIGYTRSAAARALIRGRGDTVLLALTGLPIGPHIAHLIEALTEDLGAIGLGLITHQEQPRRTLAATWRELAPAAVIAFTPVGSAEHQAMRAADVHLVCVRPGSEPAADHPVVVLAPNDRIGRLQAAHLIAAGHRRLGYAAPTDERVRHLVDLRLSGVAAACRENGLAAPSVQPVDLDLSSATSAVAAWRAEPRTTAVCAYNDELAFAVLAGMRALNLAAPHDLAVVGVDNIPTAPFANPALTTVDQDIAAMSTHLSALIADAVQGKRGEPAPPPDILRLIIRDTA
ncbi:LacI family DNA-binding transcriptional regulator [Actinokineospora iranica]|uniref:DNA-binding transcriptional regulator, LacI/PurR family n=1 Tax=Actinokineospora iranica TaxID=1271860 RepID=A0A1G6S9D1_9PSEU|nr:LacI family DNA-binding transcriptional regulator [Actinokineospora iranica]SDD13498.1 DNA-binding transcriptional regulator, LacI/PurR family [Actinokineospora iranica]